MTFQHAIRKMEMVLVPVLSSTTSLWGLVQMKGMPGTSSASLNFPLLPHRVLQRNTAAWEALLLQRCDQQGTLKPGQRSHPWLPIVPPALCFAQWVTSWFCTVSWQNVQKLLNKKQPDHLFLKGFYSYCCSGSTVIKVNFLLLSLTLSALQHRYNVVCILG